MSGASGVEVETQEVYEEEVEREEDEGEELSWPSDSEIGNKKKPEKADRATVEQAIDPRTRMLLYKMLNFGLLDRMNGCISTGKEANVYHATKSDGQELAIKVYKTSVLIYKDRDRYVQGDYRFKYGYCKNNPRKMVKTWAKKEMRNLLRLKSAGIRCPTPLLLRHHILVMEFIGNGGWAASRLKDAALSLDKLSEGYVEMILAMRTLHQKCKLVHGDLSEYNILYFEDHLYIIDVSQSVDLSHPRALDFLREDCVHVSDFFRKRGVAVMTIRELFDFIVDPFINDDSMDSYLEEVQENILARGNMVTAEEEIAESVFMQSYMPKTFNHVRNDEEDVQWTISDRVTGDMYYQKITDLTEALSISHASVAEKQQQEEEHFGGEDAEKYSVSDRHRELENGSCDEDADGESTHSEEQNLSSVNNQPTAMDRKAIRKENKKRVKEEKREARKHKIPKAGKQKKKKSAEAV